MSARAAQLQSSQPLAAAESKWDKARPTVLWCVVVAAVVFNFVLCFVNTNIFRVGTGLVILAELVLIAGALLIAFQRSLDLAVLILVLLCYFIFLGALQGSFDPKPIRDLLIPIAFYFAARRAATPELGDSLVNATVAIVLVVGIAEYLFLPMYIKLFDILGYYVSRGSVSAASLETSSDRLFASGMRYEGRTLLPMLGEHRVSSVFLEPVSVGNFGAIAFAWIVLRNWGRPLMMLLRLFPVICIFVLADARFGLAVSLLSVLVFACARFTPRILLLLAPGIMVLGLAWIGYTYPDVAWDNTLRGRILLSGQMLAGLNPQEVFSFVRTDRFVSDSGYTYTLVKIGLGGAAAMWVLFAFTGGDDRLAWRFRLFCAVYILLLLIISNSIYSIKTAALLWVLAGALDRKSEPATLVAPARKGLRSGLSSHRAMPASVRRALQARSENQPFL